MASVLTLVTFAALSAYVHLTKQSFTFLGGFLWIAFFVLLGSGLLFIFFRSHLFELALASFGTFVFACWILYDTSQILERADDDLTPAVAAFELMLDLVGLHRWVLDFFRERD